MSRSTVAVGDHETVVTAPVELAERARALADAEELAQLGTWIWQNGRTGLALSRQAQLIFGIDPAAPPESYETLLQLVHPDDLERVLVAVRAATATGATYEVQHRIVRPDHRILEVRSRGRAELDDRARPTRVIGSVQDVTPIWVAARELQRSRDLFAGVLDAATEQSIIATDPAGLITVFNTGAERMLGYRADEMLGSSPERLHDPAEIGRRAVELGVEPGFRVFLIQAATGRPETRQWTYLTRDGGRLLASITVSAMHGPDGEITGFIKVGTDITERVRAQTALEASEQRFRETFRYAPNGMMLIGVGDDNLGRLVQVNPALCRLTGYSENDLLALTMDQLVAPDDQDAHLERLAAFRIQPPADLSVERHWIRADGQDLWVHINLSPRPPVADGAFVVCQVADTSARKEAEAALRHQALHDGLTGLPNRVLLMDRIEHALAVGLRTALQVAVLYLDMDGFKSVNDSAGHAAGDQTLRHVADRMREVLRPGDTVARLGGDEFVMVCEGLQNPAAATVIAQRVLTAIRRPFTHAGETFTLTGSIGVSLSAPGVPATELLQRADQAMYYAKRAGKARVQVGDVDDPQYLAASAKAARALTVKAELGLALDRHELVLYGQPVLDLRSGVVVAVETLLRWQHPVRGIVSPGEFLDVAESCDLILPIGRLALQESCRMAASWIETLGAQAPAVHVNVSGRQLEAGNLTAEVREFLGEFALPPANLVLELTETHLPVLADSVRADLQELRESGTKVAIDDLGTGYSSLTRITELPVDILKIDLSFVARMEGDPACAAVVRGILAIGDALGLEVIAEGVETSSQATLLGEFGCTSAQGYLYSRPLPEAALQQHLQDAQRRRSLPGRVPAQLRAPRAAPATPTPGAVG